MVWVALLVVFAMVIAALRGGRLSNLTDIDTRAWWLLLVGFALQFITRFIPGSARGAAISLVLLSYALILAMVYLNRAAPGMWIAGIGLFMNFVVIMLNSGMPVLAASAEIAGLGSSLELSGRHVILDMDTVAPFLGDIIPLPRNVISLGDVFLGIGLGVFVEQAMRQTPRLFRWGVRGESGSAIRRDMRQ